MKILPVATLLVASTVLANATDESATKLLWAFNFMNDTLQASTGTVDSLSGSGTISTSEGWTTGVGSYAVGSTYANVLKFTASGDTSALKKQSGAFSVSFHVKTTETSASWPVIVSLGESNSYCLKLDDTETEMNGTLGFNADGYTSDSGWTTTRSGTKDLSSSDTWHHIVITYFGSNNSSGAGAKLYVDGEDVGASATFNSSNDYAMSMFSFGGRINNSNNTANVTFSDIAIYSGVLTTSQINYLKNNIANDTAIPEPSAFGLLAGLGAIALAVSRRRRSRR